jgi:hypothetical protein
MLNRVIVQGLIGQYGVQPRETEAGKVQAVFRLVYEEPNMDNPDGEPFKTIIPVLVVGQKAARLAETLASGALVQLQ